MDRLEILPSLEIPLEDIELSYARSGGPGGQNVNKVSSKVILRFDPARSQALTPAQGALVLANAPPRYLTKEGAIVISASEHRDQPRNRAAALERLARILREALTPVKKRTMTRPGRGARARRRDAKTRQSRKKAFRRDGTGD